MRVPAAHGIGLVLTLLLMASLPGPSPAQGQDVDRGVREAYFQAVARHFKVSPEEVSIIGDWDLGPDEVPVVLFISSRAGISPDALIGLRRSGRPWREVAGRFGLGVHHFHIHLPEAGRSGLLRRAYQEFGARPSREWDQITLEDLEIITLVNLRVLAEEVGVPPLRVLQAREEAGSFVAGFAILRRLEVSG